MKISDLKNDQAVHLLNQGNKSTPSEKGQGLKEGGKAAAGDRVEISSQSRDLQKVREILAETPDIRSEKVAALKKAVAEGTYQVSAKNIAAKMIAEILVESSRD